MLLAIEFDCISGYDNVESCQKWLQASCYSYMLNFKSFHLRKKRQGVWLSSEKRPVIGWTGDLWKYRGLKISRPEQGIVIVECGQGDCGIFAPMEFPPLRAETQQKMADRELKRQERKQARDKKRKEQKEKKKQDGQFKEPKAKRKRVAKKSESSQISTPVEFNPNEPYLELNSPLSMT